MCWLAQYSDRACLRRADGRFDRVHLIEAQRLRNEYRRRRYDQDLIDSLVRDDRIIVGACRAHHHALDVARTIRLAAEDYPPSVHEYADEHGWWFCNPTSGWLPLADDVRIAPDLERFQADRAKYGWQEAEQPEGEAA